MDVAFEFAKRLSGVEGVGYVVLFGSVARGEADWRSDIDVAIILDTDSADGISEEVSEIALDVEKEFNVSVQIVVTNRRFEGLESYFIKKLFDEGIILYGRPLLLQDHVVLEPYNVFSYSLKGLNQEDKMRVKRALYGYKTQKKYGDKIYLSTFQGTLKEYGGERLGAGSLIVPRRQAEKIEKILKRLGASYKTISVWLPVER
jgi:predicted nucleotidyltransferase